MDQLSADAKQRPQSVMIAFTKAMNKCMKIQSGKDALHLLKYSKRISEDLAMALEFGKDLYSQSLIIREWIDDVRFVFLFKKKFAVC